MAKILIVDDSPTVIAMFRRFFANRGHEVLVASDGTSGLSVAHAQQPHLIVLDRVLPDIGGFEVCRTLRADPQFKSLKVLMLTGSVDDTLAAQGKEAGVDILLTKDNGLRDIFDVATQLLEGASVT